MSSFDGAAAERWLSPLESQQSWPRQPIYLGLHLNSMVVAAVMGYAESAKATAARKAALDDGRGCGGSFGALERRSGTVLVGC